MCVGIICVLLWVSASASSIIKIYTPDDNGGTYPIEFTTGCSTNYVTYDGAKNLCTGLGAEWSLGMTPTENISNEVHTKLVNETTWLDGVEASLGSSWRWFWKSTPRRNTAIIFGRTNGCEDNIFCNFDPRKDGKVCGNAYDDYDDYLVMLASGKWQQRNKNAVREGTDCFPAKCALCQRFPCDIAIDCIENNTENVTGNVNNCVCNCKESFSGDRCQYAFADYGTFKASYAAGCSDVPLSYNSAVTKCKDLGTGWNLAALPTNASAAVRTRLLPNKAAWMAAKRDGETWKWAAGRFEGQSMNESGPWKTGSPSDAAQTMCGTNGRVAFSNTEAEWVDCAKVEESAYPTCYICEQSACTVAADCEPSGTESVSGSYGSCVCNCKQQWAGKRCELFTTIYTETYSTEYDVECSPRNSVDRKSTSYYTTTADKLCKQKGAEWSLASPATESAARLLAKLVRAKDERTWTSGEMSGGKWKWTTGRFKDQAFASTSGECYDSFYCSWATGAPITVSCRKSNYYGDGTPKYVVMNRDGNFSNTESSFSNYYWGSNQNKCPPTKCSACERSPCNISADCYAGGTLSMTGNYYPDCSCNCKPGYSGERCETFTFSAVNGPAAETAKQYTSDYRLSCATTPQTYTQAEAACQMDSSWVLGTLPSAAATEAMRTANLTNVSIWLAAGFVGSEWQWLGGRLRGTPLTSYTNWGDGAPHNETASTCDTTARTAVIVGAEGNWTDIYNDTECNTFPHCYLCERPGCVLEEDCESEHTESVSGYYGQCVCICKEGWAGSRCEKDGKLEREKYVMEYYFGCDKKKTYIAFGKADNHCQTRGNGWTIAASPDETTNNKLADLAEENAWIAGLKTSNFGGGYNWYWSAGTYNGRYKDQHFSTIYSCLGWCKFPSGKPNQKRVCGGYNDNLILSPQGQWLQQNKNPNLYGDCHLARCYLCERSRCNISADCFTSGTESVSGWYPNCHCVCKPGFKGDKCNKFSLVSAAAPLSFEYEGICDVNNNPVPQSTATCSTLGSDYSIASFATANATTDFAAVLNQSGIVAWIGATRVDGSFQWTEGRFSGQVVDANITNYFSGRPSSETCSSSGAQSKYLSITDEGVVYDNYGDIQCDKSFGNPNVSCYVCERSPCVLEVDCNATNTLDVRGYYGDCRCYCNSEYGGPRCDDYNVVNSTTYVTQYTVGCAATYISFSDGEAACKALDDGWMIAAVPSAEANINIQKFIPNGERAWLGGYISWSSSKWTWGGSDSWAGASSYNGRSKGVSFAGSTTCDNDVWCNFTGGNPSSPKGAYCPNWGSTRFVVMNSDGTWQQTTEDASSETSPCFPSRCYACERSPCSATKDCFAKGTDNVTGYYPNCMCHCKDNFTGEKCDTAIHHGAAYVSEYKLSCSTQAIPYTSARTLCQRIGDAWNVATVPTAAAAETVLPLLDENQTAWLAGTDQFFEGEWGWRAGRQKGKLFYNGTPVDGYYSAWGTGWPRNESCGVGMTSDYLVMLGNGTWVHTYPEKFESCLLTQPLPFCTVCERQPCNIALDCDANNSVSVVGSYPECRCVCKEGWGGARCNVSSTVYNIVDGNGYFSEYNVKCEDRRIAHDDAVKRCKTLDAGWVLASVPSEEANNVIASMANEPIWLGAWEGRLGNGGLQFTWLSDTRAKGYQFTTDTIKRYHYRCKEGAYCQITGEINTALSNACGTFPEKLAMDTDKTWKGYSKSKSSNCNLLARCYACERSPCNTTLDCTEENTERASGYYPSCTCHCKFGYYGNKCEHDGLVPDSNVSNPDTYATMYRFECISAYWGVSYEKAMDKCREYGESWQLATVGSFAAFTKIQESATGGTYWLAGFDTENGWKWETGRLNGKLFYQDGSCLQQGACGFGNGEPAASNAFLPDCHRKLATEGGVWSAELPTSSCSSSASRSPKCYVCERSLCKHITDCNVTHSDNVTGFYPKCQCGCHAGWGGPRCSERVCHVDTDCGGLAVNVTGEYPHCQCIGCPKGHRPRDCATLTSSATLASTATLSSTPTVVLNTETASATHDARRALTRTISLSATSITTTETSETNDTITNDSTSEIITSESTGATNETSETTAAETTTTETTSITDTAETTTTTTTNTTETTTTETTTADTTIGTTETTTEKAPNETASVSTTGENTITDMSSTTTSTLCQFNFNISCNRDIYYEPAPSIHLSLEITALASASSVSLLLPVSLQENGHVPLALIGSAPDNHSTQLSVTKVVAKQSGLELTMKSLVNLTKITDTEISVFVVGCCRNVAMEDTIRIAIVKLVVPEKKNNTIGVVDESVQEDFNNAAERSKSNLRDERSELLGAPEDSHVLRAFSPVALLVGGSDGYTSLLLSNLIIIVVVTVIHFIAVMVYRARTRLPFLEVCATLSFPSLSLYIIYALLPGISLAAGGLTRVGNAVGVVALLFTLGVVVNSGVYPYLYLTRGLYLVPLLPEKGQTKAAILFPTTVLAPTTVASAYAALVKNYRYPLALWTTLPTWSSLIILIAALVSTNVAICVVAGVAHFIVILIIIVIRPHSCLALDVMYCLGILPVGVLAIVRGVQINKGPGSHEGVSDALLIILTIVTALRLGAALCSPFNILSFASFDNITHEAPLWVFNSKCGPEFQSPNDLEVAMFSFKEASDVAGEGVLFPDNGSSVSGASGQPGRILPKSRSMDSSSSIGSAMPAAVQSADAHTVRSAHGDDINDKQSLNGKGRDAQSSVIGDNQSGISGISGTSNNNDDPFD